MYNRALKKTAEEIGVRLIDIRTAMKKAGDFSVFISDDGIHPTESGYQAIAHEVYESLLFSIKGNELKEKSHS